MGTVGYMINPILGPRHRFPARWRDMSLEICIIIPEIWTNQLDLLEAMSDKQKDINISWDVNIPVLLGTSWNQNAFSPAVGLI